MPRILAVDDDPSMEVYYDALLSEAGYDVRTAPNADSAVEILASHRPELLVLDAEMPGGGGEKVFTTARKLLSRGIPVIFVTGLPDRVIYFALTQAKVRIFRKPLKEDELLKSIEELLAGGSK